MTKPLMDLPMDTKNHDCGCGGPAKHVETVCPTCGEVGLRVKAATVRYHLHDDLREEVTDRIYGLCLTPTCEVAWYAQEEDHAFTTKQTETPIWTKAGASPVMACYCNEITREMVSHAVKVKGLRTMEEIILLHRDEISRACAANNPSGQCCQEHFEKMIGEELTDYIKCNC